MNNSIEYRKIPSVEISMPLNPGEFEDVGIGDEIKFMVKGKIVSKGDDSLEVNINSVALMEQEEPEESEKEGQKGMPEIPEEEKKRRVLKESKKQPGHRGMLVIEFLRRK